jgi:hypothetical protein
MIYFTTFILALFLSQIARALPQAYGDVITPELPTPVDQFNIPVAQPTTTAVVAYNHKYDNPNTSTSSVACWNLYPLYPEFHNFPSFPRIGGAFDIGLTPGPHCGKCWELTNLVNNRSVVITAMDHAGLGFVVPAKIYIQLKDGPLGPPLRHVQYINVPLSVCT